MILAPITGTAGSAAASAVAGWIGAWATGTALDAMLDHTIGVLDGSGEQATQPQTPTLSAGPQITMIAEPGGTNILQEIQIGPAGGPPDLRLGLMRTADQLDLNIGATASDFETLSGLEGGDLVLRDLRQAIDAYPSQEQNEQRMLQGAPEQQRAISRAARNGIRPRISVRRQNERLGSISDRSRTSMEYHEWRHNCLFPGENWWMVEQKMYTDHGQALDYVGADPAGAYFAPPYYQWIHYEDLRKLINLVKKYRRLRGKCGGKALWTQQGFADKDTAVSDDLANDSEFTTLRSALAATSDFQLLV